MPERAKPLDSSLPMDIVQRVGDRIRRSHSKARLRRTAALGLRGLQIVIAGCIPVLALVNPGASKPAVNGVLGAAIVVIEGFQHSFRFEHFWIKYRQAAVELESELALYTGRGRPYAGSDAQSLFVERVASLIKKQAEGWADTIKKSLPK
jgi:hypothetical protein